MKLDWKPRDRLPIFDWLLNVGPAINAMTDKVFFAAVYAAWSCSS